MRRPQVESLQELDALLAQGSLDSHILQGLDLTQRTAELSGISVREAVFLGCKLDHALSVHLMSHGAVLFPDLGAERPYHPTRSRLYDLEELMQGFDPDAPGSFELTADYAIYTHFKDYREKPLPPLLEALAQRIHDHAIDDALAQVLTDPTHQRVVGVMGGHALKRGAKDYVTVAHIAWALAKRGYFIATGGGPGAMEAANLGAYMSLHSRDELGRALAALAPYPDYKEHAYLLAGYQVLDAYPEGASSLAIPTWFYGHEPSNQFARHIAKYFSNSLREDGLLAIAKHGVIYAPGSAGTVQEVFMDGAQNHYGTFEMVSPMVFLGIDEWTNKRPVLPLLQSLSRGKQYERYISVLDTVDEVVEFIETHPPERYA